MTYFTVLVSIFLGAVAGIVYGYSFLQQIYTDNTISNCPLKNIRRKNFLSSFLFASIRILLIGLLWYYLLSSNQASIILVLGSFLVSFWIMIIKKKAS